ncbi:MAG: hypothetical protein PHQ23_15570 [Candidatus Wallbacteria bacterium]|nr:hypothetical protein [Candidatus Wallbacteria bacterium]
MNHKAVTLMEIFVSLVIIVILASLLAIGYTKKSTDRSQNLCHLNMKAIAAVVELYRTETRENPVIFASGSGRFSEQHTNALKTFFNENHFPDCPSGGFYGINDFGELFCSTHKKFTIPLPDTQQTPVSKPVQPAVQKIEPMATLNEDETYFQKGRTLFKEKKFSQSAYMFEKAFESNKEKTFYLFHASDAYFQAEEFIKAREVLSPVIKQPRAQEQIREIKKYEYFRARLSSYDSDYALYYLLKTFGKDETLNKVNIFGKDDSIIGQSLHMSQNHLSIRDRTLFFSSSSKIFRYDIDSGNSAEFFDNSGLLFTGMRYHKDKLLFLSPKVNNNLQLVLLDIKTRIALGITSDKMDVKKAEFSTNGFYIFYLAGNRIYRYNIETKQNAICWEAPEISAIIDFDLHPRKEILAVVVTGLNTSPRKDIMLVDLEGKTHAPVTTTQGLDEILPLFSPQGNFFSFMVKNGKLENIYAYDMNNASSFALTDFTGDVASFFPSFCWFPDEQFIFFSWGEPSSHALHILELSTKKYIKILEKGCDIGGLQLLYSIKKDGSTLQQNLKLFH